MAEGVFRCRRGVEIDRRGVGLISVVVDAVVEVRDAGFGVDSSTCSDDGESSPGPGLRGVRNGDLKGLLSVLAAVFRRRRFAWGVDIASAVLA